MAFGYAVYFTERARNRVVRWEPDTGKAEVIAGEPKDEDRTQKLADPYGLTIDKDGFLLIADKLNHRICRLRKGRLEEVPLLDKTGHRRRLPTSSRDYRETLLTPAGLFTRKDGAILAAFFNDLMLYRIHPDGKLEPVAGMVRNQAYVIGSAREVIPPALVPTTPLYNPVSAVERSDGTVFFIERGYQIIREFHPARGIRSLFPFSRQGEWCLRPRAPEKGSLSDYAPPFPAGLTLDSKDVLYVSDFRHGCVLTIDLGKQSFRRVLEVQQSGQPPGKGVNALAFGPDQTAWIVDATGNCIAGYRPEAKGPWTPLGVVLRNVRGEPLELKPGGCGLVAAP